MAVTRTFPSRDTLARRAGRGEVHVLPAQAR